MSDGTAYDTLLNRIELLESNTSLKDVQEKLNETKSELHDAMERISSLEQTVRAMQDKLSDVTHRMAQLESDQSRVSEEIAELNNTKATRVDVRHLISELDTRKADKTEFEMFSYNLTLLQESTSREDEEIREDLTELVSALNQTHYDQLQDGIDRLEESKADQTALEVVVVTLSELANSTVTIRKTVDGFENTTQILEGHTLQLETEVDSARAAIADLNTTKASKEDLNNATIEIMVLEASKVDKAEFEILSHNLTLLRESTSREDEEIREDLAELADTALNQTHYDQLQDGIDRLEESKADQTDLQVVASTVSELANSTVRNSETVDGIENTIVILEGGIAELNATKATNEDLRQLYH